MPSDELDPHIREQVADMMRATMVENALHHRADNPFQSIDPFSAAILEHRGLLTATAEARSGADVAALLSAPDTSTLLPAPEGPYVFVRDGDRGGVVDPAELLVDPVASNRLAALRHYAALPTTAIAGRSRKQIEDARPRVASDERTEWFAAAKGVYDLLQNDMYMCLAGFGQCYAVGYSQGVDRFLPRLLRPDAALLASIDLECWSPADDDSLRKVVNRLITIRSVSEVLTEYHRQLGHLPLSGAVGLGGVLRGWSAAHSPENLWEAVWTWADECESPVARYHACAAFLANPEFVPAGVEEFLWGEIGDIVNGYTGESGRTRWVEAWALRDGLAAHFGNYLECLLPGLPGERLSAIGWWLTERLCELLPTSPGLLRKLRETTFAGEFKWSSLMNHLTHPPVVPSSLRYMTRLGGKTWSASLLCELGRGRWLFERTTPSLDVGHGIDGSLIGLLLRGYPRPVTAAARPVYGFEQALGPAATLWAEVTSDAQQDAGRVDMAEALRVADEFSSPSQVAEHMARLGDELPEDDLRAAHFLRQMAHFDPTASDTIWREFNTDDRWRAVCLNADADALGVLFEALTELQVRHGGEWRLCLAHMFAVTSSETQDPARRQLLFGMALFASIHAGGVSAIDRLMHGTVRGEFATFASRWRDKLVPALRVMTPWSAGRIRSVLPSLMLDELEDFGK